MKKLLFALGIVMTLGILPELILPQWGGVGSGAELESKINALTHSIISVILPSVSILGLVYAAILAATGDQGARPRMVLIIIASVMGFLSPLIISWLKSVSGV